MELIVGCIVVLLLILGIIGSFVPAVPGPPLAYVSLLLYHFYLVRIEDISFLWMMAFVVILVTILDFWVQIYGVKKFGGTKKAVNGSMIGLVIGLIFLPGIGILIGPLLGAFIGAQMEQNANLFNSVKVALGAFVGFFVGTLLKLSFTFYIIYIISVSFFSHYRENIQ